MTRVSNFARRRLESRHNVAYWRNRYYVAAGVGAHGHLPAAAAPALGIPPTPDAVAVRYWHGRGIAAYCESTRHDLLPVRDFEHVDARSHEEERVMLGLRLRGGVTITDAAMRRQAEDLRAAGLLELDGDVARTTRAGETLLNAVTERITSPVFAHATTAAL